MWADPQEMLEEDPNVFCGKSVDKEGNIVNSPRYPKYTVPSQTYSRKMHQKRPKYEVPSDIFRSEKPPETYSFDEKPPRKYKKVLKKKKRSFSPSNPSFDPTAMGYGAWDMYINEKIY